MNMQNLMAQAQKMQRDITAKKEELENTNFTGKSEWVEVIFNGAKTLQSMKIIKEGAIDESEKEVLEDMIKIACDDAYNQITKAMNEKLGQYAGVMDGLM